MTRAPRSRGWLALMLAGVLLGGLLLTPAGAHVTSDVGHLWRKHLRPLAKKNFYTKRQTYSKAQADTRFLGKTDKAVDAVHADTADNASNLGGQPASSYPRLLSVGQAGAVGMNFYSYFMNTSGVNRYNFGQAAIETTGTSGQFRVCGNSSAIATFNYVAYVNGTRAAGTVAANGCTGAFAAGAGGDFQVSIRRAQIFGAHSGDGTANGNYNLYGFSQL
jgi:hypothetical protein